MSRSNTHTPGSSSVARRSWWTRNLFDSLFRLAQILNPLRRDPASRDSRREAERKKRLQPKLDFLLMEDRRAPSDTIMGNLVLMNLVHLGFDGTVATAAEEEEAISALGSSFSSDAISLALTPLLSAEREIPSSPKQDVQGSLSSESFVSIPSPSSTPEAIPSPESGGSSANFGSRAASEEDSFRGVGLNASASDSGAVFTASADLSSSGGGIDSSVRLP